MNVGLQAAVLEQRDLHGAVRRQRALQEILDPLLDGEGLGLAGDLDDVLVQLGVGDRLRGGEPGIGARTRRSRPASGWLRRPRAIPAGG